MDHSVLVIVPTYNESNNIERLIKKVMSLDGMDLLIIDDGSPDGTADIVKKLKQQFAQKLFLIERSGKLGLGTAYVRGFQHALEHDYTYVCEIDADFSHNPEDLPRFVNELTEVRADVTVVSRYANDIRSVN